VTSNHVGEEQERKIQKG